jgi:cytochrome c oxidase assembly factor CtaG
MKKNVKDFIFRGFFAGGFGPLVLAVLYLILQKNNLVQTLTVNEMSKGIFSLYILAFIAGGMNVIYQIERLPLMTAILIHGGVLYVSYLCTYLFNGWLEWGMMPILVFSGIFVLGYVIVWVIIYSVNKKRTDKLNQMLDKKRLTK